MANCPCCNKTLGFFEEKTKLSDGAVCAMCKADAKIPSNVSLNHLSCAEMQYVYSDRRYMPGNFKSTKWKSIFHVDAVNRQFKIKRSLFSSPTYKYENLLRYELIENETIVSSGGLGSAIIGGVVAGPAGAIVGGLVGNKKQKALCESLKIRLVLQNTYVDTEYIDFVKTPTKKTDFIYKHSYEEAQKVLRLLEEIISSNESVHHEVAMPSTGTFSVADELQKLKGLLDSGAINLDEFETLKNNIMNK